MSRHDELKRLASAWNDAWNGGDAGKLAAFFTEDATYYEPALPEPMPGRAGVKRAAEKVGSSRVDLQACKLEYSIVSPK